MCTQLYVSFSLCNISSSLCSNGCSEKKQNSVSDDVLCKLSLGDGKFLMFVLFLTLY